MAINTEAALIGTERRQADLDPLLSLLPVQPEAELERSTLRILVRRPDQLSTVLTMMSERFPTLSPTPS